MALARMDIPGLVFYNGSIAPGHYDGRTSRSRTSSRASARYIGGTMTGAELHELESAACPAPAPAAASSPPTRWRWRSTSSASARPALSGIPATHERKADAAVAAGRLVMDVVRRDLRPRS